MPPKVWFKFVDPEYDWHDVSLEGVEDVPKLKRALRAIMEPLFDHCPSAELTIKVAEIIEEEGDFCCEQGDPSSAVGVGRKESLKSILRRFGIEDHRPSIQEAFARKIKLFVASAQSGQISERQILTLLPHSLTYTPDSQWEKEQKTTPEPNWARAPASVVSWQGFTHKARLMTLSDAPWYSKPIFRRHHASGEWDVQYALNLNVLHLLSDTIGSNQLPKEVFLRHEGHEEVQGEPDFILTSGKRLILAVEVKTKWDLSVGDIVEMYHDNLKDLAEHRVPSVSVIDRIKEIYGYMGHNELQYGVLSTYESTWFLWRPQNNPGKLLISEVVMNTATDPTLLQCFAYIMSLARRSPNSPVPPPAPEPPPTADCKPPSEKDYDRDSNYHLRKGLPSSRRRWRQGRDRRAGGKMIGSSNTNEQSKEVLRPEDFGWDGLRVIGVIGFGRCGTVYKASLRGEEVAYKLCDLWKHPEYEKELLNEAGIYMSLEQLQGRTIPKLKGIGYTAGGFMGIATEITGSPIKVQELSDKESNEILRALSKIHDHGVLHNDISVDNILIQRHRDGFKITFIDFALSRKVSSKGEATREMAKLRRMLGLPPDQKW